MSKIRQLRVAQEIFRVLTEAFFTDELLSENFANVFLMEVFFLEDMKLLKITCQASNQDKKVLLQKLADFTPYIRSIIAQELNLKRTPSLTFTILDGNFQ